MRQTFVALDLETTGLNPSSDRILEIGAVKVINGQVCETYETLINPGMRISSRIEELTGISNEMVINGIAPGEAVRKLVDFCEGFPLLGHNILFDYSFVKRAAVNLNLTFEKKGIDTLKIARNLLPDLESRSLECLCSHFHITQGRAHRAVNDAYAALELYRILKERFPESSEELFEPKELVYKVKKQSSITQAQKSYLNDLVKYHKIALEVSIDTLTKNEASRIIDKIILENGRIQR